VITALWLYACDWTAIVVCCGIAAANDAMGEGWAG